MPKTKMRYEMATKDQKEKAWKNSKKIRGKDPDKYRQDPYGIPCISLLMGDHLKWDGKLTILSQSQKAVQNRQRTCKPSTPR